MKRMVIGGVIGLLVALIAISAVVGVLASHRKIAWVENVQYQARMNGTAFSCNAVEIRTARDKYLIAKGIENGGYNIGGFVATVVVRGNLITADNADWGFLGISVPYPVEDPKRTAARSCAKGPAGSDPGLLVKFLVS